MNKLNQPTNIGGEAHTSFRWISFAVGLLIAVVGFLCHLGLELKFERLEVYNQYNVFFDADPNVVLYSFTNLGETPNVDPYYQRQLAHPNVVGFFAVPIRALVTVVTTIIPNKSFERNLLRLLALLIVPVGAAVFYLVMHYLFLRLRFSLTLASLLTLLAFVSFNQVLFGSIPELFAISNLAIALAYLLFVIYKDLKGIRCFIAWAVVGMFATGVTITNIVPIIILFWIKEIYNRKRFFNSIIKVVGLATLILALTFTLQKISLHATRIERPSLKQEAGWIQAFGTKNILNATRKFLTFPEVFIDSILAPEPSQKPNQFAIEMNPAARYPFQFSFDYNKHGKLDISLFTPRNLVGIALLLLLLLPVRALSNGDRSLLLLSWGSWLIIIFNWIFHSLWGSERFLYSQHWHVPLFFLFAVLVSTQLRSSRTRNGVVLTSVILVAINSAIVMRTILITLMSN